MITFDFKTYRQNLITDDEIRTYSDKLKELNQYLSNHQNYIGWLNMNKLSNQELIEDILKTSDYIKNNCDVFLVVGIGGSYLGASAIIEALNPYFYNNIKKPQIYFVGNSLSSSYFEDLKEIIKDKDIIINVISKSGTTFETTITYNLVMELMNSKYTKEELQNRVIITTENKDNPLFNLAKENNYKFYEIPLDIPGRFSVLTPAGLLPIAVSGVDIKELLNGASESSNMLDDCKEYAVIKDIMANKGKFIEAFVVYEPKLEALTEWLKQLYAESLGKEHKGILPINIINTRDLHSLGQYIQDGMRIIFETVINIKSNQPNIIIKDYNKSLNDINNIASKSATNAHYEDSILNNIIILDELNAYNIGYLIQFFMISCSISALLSDVNAFNQDGVEKYKSVMKDLLKSNL